MQVTNTIYIIHKEDAFEIRFISQIVSYLEVIIMSL